MYNSMVANDCDHTDVHQEVDTHVCDLQELTSDPEVWELLVHSSWKSQFTSNYHTSGAPASHRHSAPAAISQPSPQHDCLLP